MRELTINEIEQVSGAGDLLATIIEWTEFGGMTGSVVGYALTGTVQGATRGGLTGAAYGFAWGLGTGFGTEIYERFIQ